MLTLKRAKPTFMYNYEQTCAVKGLIEELGVIAKLLHICPPSTINENYDMDNVSAANVNCHKMSGGKRCTRNTRCIHIYIFKAEQP